MRPTLRALGLRKLSEIPSHIPTVVWSWVVSGIGRAPTLTKGGLKVRMDEVWMHAAFSERIDAGLDLSTSSKEKGIAGAEEDFSRISYVTSRDVSVGRVGSHWPTSDFTPHHQSTNIARPLHGMYDSEDDSGGGINYPAGATSSRPTSPMRHSMSEASSSKLRTDKQYKQRLVNDPLAKFYAKARAEHETRVSFQC